MIPTPTYEPPTRPPGLHPTVVVGEGFPLVLADDCVAGPFVTIGSAPFVYPRDKIGIRHAAPVNGSVRIEPGVRIHAHANVDRGLEQATVIGARCLIDHHVHVGHDAYLAHDVTLCAGTIVGGFVSIGAGTTLGLGVIVLPNVSIGANCYVGAGAVVREDVPPNTKVAGVPARVIGRNA